MLARWCRAKWCDLPGVTWRSQIAAISALLLVIVAGWSTTTAAVGEDPAGADFFETKIRPVLAEHCYACHSAQAKKLKGNLLLDSTEGIRKGGDSGPTFVPGKPDESSLIQAVRYEDELTKMPPKGKLPAATIAVLEQWIAGGAPGPSPHPVTAPAAARSRGIDFATGRKHWSFQPVVRHEPPPIKDRDWPSSPIDPFVLAKLEAAGLKPSPPADRRTLLRRAYYDLIGLPPTAEEIEAFERRPFARRIRPSRRSATGLAALRRAMGTALARRRPLRRHQGRSVDVR